MKKHFGFFLAAALLLSGCTPYAAQDKPTETTQPHIITETVPPTTQSIVEETVPPTTQSIIEETVPPTTQSITTESQMRKLSEFTDEELLAFLAEYEIEIPYDYRDTKKCANFIRYVAAIVEKTPDFQFGFSYPVTVEFAEAIRNATLVYYNFNN